MLRIALVFSLLALGSARAGDGRVRVVATVPNLASICRAVGGDRVEVSTICAWNQDAHAVDPRPSYVVKLRDADLLLVTGLDLEMGWVPPLTERSRNARVLRGGPGYVDCSQGIDVLEVPAGPVTRAEGDVHPFGNPHYLTDPGNARVVAGTIAGVLARASPAGAGAFEAGRKAFERLLDEAMFGAALVDGVGGAQLWRLHAEGRLDAFLQEQGPELGKARGEGWAGRMRGRRGLPIVTYHKDLSYFVRRFGLEVAGHVEVKPGIPPSARHLVELTETIRRREAPLLVTRPYAERRSTDLLAARTGIAVLVLPLDCGEPGGAQDYLGWMDATVAALARLPGG